jgi:hypothetical protein
MVSDEELPQDPWGATEELILMMQGMNKLYMAALQGGFPDHAAIQFVSGVFTMMVQAAQQKDAKE